MAPCPATVWLQMYGCRCYGCRCRRAVMAITRWQVPHRCRVMALLRPPAMSAFAPLLRDKRTSGTPDPSAPIYDGVDAPPTASMCQAARAMFLLMLGLLASLDGKIAD